MSVVSECVQACTEQHGAPVVVRLAAAVLLICATTGAAIGREKLSHYAGPWGGAFIGGWFGMAAAIIVLIAVLLVCVAGGIV